MATNEPKKTSRVTHHCTVCGHPCRPKGNRKLCFRCAPETKDRQAERLKKNVEMYHRRVRNEALLIEILEHLQVLGLEDEISEFRLRIETDTRVRFSTPASVTQVTSQIGSSSSSTLFPEDKECLEEDLEPAPSLSQSQALTLPLRDSASPPQATGIPQITISHSQEEVPQRANSSHGIHDVSDVKPTISSVTSTSSSSVRDVVAGVGGK